MNFNGKLTAKVVIKDDYKRADGTCALYLQVFLNQERKRFPVNISVDPKHFDKDRQRVRPACLLYKDYNLLIEKMLADINRIEVSYRLSNQVLNIDKLVNELHNPSSRIDFISFWEKEMEHQEKILKPGTYRQQMSMLNKLREYQKVLPFYDITPEFLETIKAYMKKELKNNDNTVNSFVKSFKKYLHIAHKRGIIVPLDHEDIKLRQFKSDRTFLMPEEIKAFFQFWQSPYISATHKIIVGKFLFSCFTGLRFQDVEQLTEENFVDNILVFTAGKTAKFQRIVLNDSARQFVADKSILNIQFTNEYVNRELKTIAKVLGIRKKITYHVSRHTFATNFLISGGRLEHLQKLLNHSNIRETLVYVHIVESITDQQILNMDDILK